MSVMRNINTTSLRFANHTASIVSTPRIRAAVLGCFAIAFALAMPAAANAQVTWSGTGANANWDSAGNWSTTLSNNFNNGLVFAGTNLLSNTNTLTGGTATSITFNAGAGAFIIGGNSLTLTGNVTNNSSNVQTLGLVLAGTSGVTFSGGTTTLSGGTANTLTGLITVGSGALQLNKTAGVNAIAGNVQVNSGGTLRLSAANQIVDTGTVTVNWGGTWDLNGQNETIRRLVAVGVSGTAPTITLGSGTLTLNAIQYTGTSGNAPAGTPSTTIGGTTGTLRFVPDGATQPTFATGWNALNDINSAVQIDAASLSFNLGTYSTTVAGKISGTGAVIKGSQGGGFTLSNSANDYSGGTQWIGSGSNGTYAIFQVPASGALGTGTVTLSNGNTANWTTGATGADPSVFTFTGNTTQANNFSLTGNAPIGISNPKGAAATSDTVLLTGSFALGANTLFLRGRGTGTISGPISGSGGVTKIDPFATWSLSGSNGFTGATTITAGTLSLSNQNAIQNSTLTMNGGGVVFSNAVSGNAFTVGGLSASGTGAGYDIVLRNNAGTPAAIALTVGGNNASTIYAAVLSGSGSLIKIGTGTLTLSGSSTFTGATTISAASLALGSAGSIASSGTVTVGNAGSTGAVLDLTAMSSSYAFGAGQKVQGIGTINIGAGKTVSSAGIWAPGNSIGSNVVTGNLSLSGTSQFELGTPGTSTTASGTSDFTAVSGTLTLGGNLALVDNANAGGLGSYGAGAYRLFTYGDVTGSYASITPATASTRGGIALGGSGTSAGQGVFLNVYNLASATAAQTITLGNARAGASGTVSLTNIATANATYTETLSTGSFSNTTANFTTSGSASGIAGGGSGAGNLAVGFGSSLAAGARTGTTTLALFSNAVNASGLAQQAVTAQTITISGTVYDFANAKYTGGTYAFGNVRTGSSASAQNIAFGNQTITNASFQDLLNVSGSTTNAAVTAAGFTGLAASASGATTQNLVLSASTATAGSLASTVSLNLVSNANGVSGLSNGTASVVGSPAAITTTGGVYDFAQAKFSGATLAFGVVHQGASVSSQSVAFGNQTVTNASYQDSLDVSATTGNARVTATGFTGLAATAGGATTNNLVVSVGTGTAGSLASTLTLTLTSNANSVAGLSNGTAGTVGGGSITTTGGVFSGNGIWNVNGGGSWGTGANANWTSTESVSAAPGTFAGYADTDTARFGAALAGGTASIKLNGAQASLASITFDNTSGRYLIESGTGAGSLTLAVASGKPAIDVVGIHEIAAAINGTSGLQKTGLGTLVLSGSSTYSGGTDITAGTLAVNGFLGNAVNVANAAILGGSGVLGGPVTVAAGGILAPGNSPGTLTINSSLVLNAGSILNFELNATDSTAGSGINDLVNVGGNFTLAGILNVAGIGNFANATDFTTWRLFNYTGTLTGTSLTLGSMPSVGSTGKYFQIDTATAGQVNLVIVPEPGALALAGLGIGLAGWLIRRRK